MGREVAIMNVRNGMQDGTYTSVEDAMLDVMSSIQNSSLFDEMQATDTLPFQWEQKMKQAEFDYKDMQKQKEQALINKYKAETSEANASAASYTASGSYTTSGGEGSEFIPVLNEKTGAYEWKGNASFDMYLDENSIYRNADGSFDYNDIAKQFVTSTGKARDAKIAEIRAYHARREAMGDATAAATTSGGEMTEANGVGAWDMVKVL